jgi:hypothetical protein
MTNKTKVLYLIIGFMACLIVFLIIKTEFSYIKTEVSKEFNNAPIVTKVTVRKAHWIIQTTYKLLK